MRAGWRRVLVGAALGAALLAATVPGLPASAPRPEPIRAVVAVHGPAALEAPGVRVLARYPSIGTQVVSADGTALNALARHPRVRGVSADTTLTTTGHSSGDGRSVFAWQGLGGKAGKPDTGAGVTVALLDTGVSDNPALNRASHRLVDGVDTSRLAEGGDAFTSGVFADRYGHGTYMASLIAGGVVAGTGGRAVGVAPMARVVVVKVADARGSTHLSEVLAGLDWIAVQAPRIQLVSIALSHPRPQRAYGEDPLTVAVEHVQSAGVAVVAAVGNRPGEVGDPGLDPHVITVGAADLRRGERDRDGDDGDNDSDGDQDGDARRRVRVASFSGSGVVAGVRKPDIVASGVGVLGAIPSDSHIARTHPSARQPNGLWRGSGTSQATAITAGVAAAFLSDNADATLSQVKPSLRAAASPLADSRAGAGLVRMAKRVAGDPDQQRRGDRGWGGRHDGVFDEAEWKAHAWLGGGWQDELASLWSPVSPTASSWAASSWAASSWGASSWSASSWAASSWGAWSWGASSWAASSWAASSWAASSWAASSWAASSWAASSWAVAGWGTDP